MAGFEVPGGWTVQAFQFALDCTPEQAACVRRQFGGRRYARNWAVRTLKEDLTRYRETGEQTDAPSLARLRKRWNQVKDAECVGRSPARRSAPGAATGAGAVLCGTGRSPAVTRPVAPVAAVPWVPAIQSPSAVNERTVSGSARVADSRFGSVSGTVTGGEMPASLSCALRS
jgi:hypothetical protein